VTVGLDPVKTAYAPGRFCIRIPIEVERHPAAERIIQRFLDDVRPLLDHEERRYRLVPIDPGTAPCYVLEFKSLPWQRRRVGRMVAELAQWIDAWADRALVGGRMALRSLLADDETIHLNEPLPF
jgi:hypothetical protein